MYIKSDSIDVWHLWEFGIRNSLERDLDFHQKL